jgi:hypothetical protein
VASVERTYWLWRSGAGVPTKRRCGTIDAVGDVWRITQPCTSCVCLAAVL